MSRERYPLVPQANFNRGLVGVDIPELGKPIRGKVRDSWVINKGESHSRIIVTTDRTSAYDSVICTIPGKGQVLNELSAYWFDQTNHLVPNHIIDVPHPNVTIAKEAKQMIPVEVVLRRYMAESSTSTSIFHNYVDRGRRNIYGIDFPDGLRSNEEFSQTILTPTTKGEIGQHDEEITDMQAADIVDSQLGHGVWERTKQAAQVVFEFGRIRAREGGLLLVDTKFEFGLDEHGTVMLTDEVLTPDSSRFWKADTYEHKMRKGEKPDSFDKDILRRWLADQGYRGEGSIPQVDNSVIGRMAEAYTVPFTMITGRRIIAPEIPVYDAVTDYLSR